MTIPTTPPPSNIEAWGWEWIKWISGFFDFIVKFYNDVFGVATEWAGLSYSSGWGDLGGSTETGQYRLFYNGMVQLKGTLEGGFFIPGTLMATLPVGFRPKKEQRFPVATRLVIRGEVRIQADGQIIFDVGDIAYLSLDNISFEAKQ